MNTDFSFPQDASPAVTGTPEEEVGYLASDEYMHRMASPPPDARNESQPVAESPLRQMSFPASEIEPKVPGSPLRHGRSSSHGHRADGEVIHVDDPKHPLHHPDGFAPTLAPYEHTPDVQEPLEDDEPILAADEVRPDSAYLHPAISPTFEHRGSLDEERSRTPSVSHSRSDSRSASAQGAPMLSRFDSRELHEDMSTPLEDVEEYEPLFPEEGDSKKPRSLSATERFKKRPDMHKFPSEDIWEDAPNSLQLHATVTTPDIPKRESSEVFETPEQEAARRKQTSKVDSHQVARHILQGEGARDQAKVPAQPDAIKQRFPSRDIWEDAPDSQQLVTTVQPANDEVKSPEVPSKPSIPPRPQKQAQATSPTDKRPAPLIPDRPKPQIPARPAKPAIPARPGGSKIAALKAGFLTDLNSRLQLGPQQPKPQEKEPEPPAEKQPLSDARKGRARGPARRKPATENANARLPSIPEIKITETWNVWSVGQDGNLTVGSEDTKPSVPGTDSSIPSEPPMAPKLAKNTAGESVDPVPATKSAVEVVSPSTVAAREAEAAEPHVSKDVPASIETPSAATELTSKQEEPEVTESPAGAQPLADHVSTSTKIDDVLEDLAASADGKKISDGDVHATESSA